MRLGRPGRASRRGLLGWGLGAAGVGLAGGAIGFRALSRARGPDAAVPAEVRATPIRSFTKLASERLRFGGLRFRSGLVLSSATRGFGGFSALWRDPAGGRALVSVSDEATWLTAAVTYREGALSGLSEARLAPLLGEDDAPLGRGPAYDTESLAITEGVAFVGIERVHEVRRFEWARDGVAARGVPLPLPPETKDLPSNASFEAVAVAPPGHPLAGAVVAIAEEARPGPSAPTRGWVVTGPDRFAFDLARSDDFDVTDAGFLPSGELLILERRFTILAGVACRLRRISRDALRPGPPVDGRVIFEADDTHEIDNMEGLAIHADPSTGETVLTMISDDNFSRLQRTLLLEFTLAG